MIRSGTKFMAAFVMLFSLAGCKGWVSITDMTPDQKAVVARVLKESFNENHFTGFTIDFPRSHTVPFFESDLHKAVVTFMNLKYVGLIHSGTEIRFSMTIDSELTDKELPPGIRPFSFEKIANLTGVNVDETCHLKTVVLSLYDVQGDEGRMEPKFITLWADGNIDIGATADFRGSLANSYGGGGRGPRTIDARPETPALFASVSKRLEAAGLCHRE